MQPLLTADSQLGVGLGGTAWGTPAGECRVPLSPNLQESSSAQGPAVRSRPSSPSSKSLRGQWPRDGGCGYRVRGGVLPSPVRGGGSPSLCGPGQRCPRNPPGAEKPDTDPSPGPDAAPPVSPQSVPSGPRGGLGSARATAGYSRPTSQPPPSWSPLLRAAPSGEPGCARRSHTPAPPAGAWDGPHGTPGLPARRAGAGLRNAGHCRGPRGCAPVPGDRELRRGAPPIPEPDPVSRWTLRALSASASADPAPGPSRVARGSFPAPLPVRARPPRSYRAASSGRWAGRSGVRGRRGRAGLQEMPGDRAQRVAEGGGRERAGARRRREAGGERREPGTAAAAKPGRDRRAQEPARRGPGSLPAPARPALGLSTRRRTCGGSHRSAGWGHSPENGQEAGRRELWPLGSAGRGSCF